jgi:hypothetical protein
MALSDRERKLATMTVTVVVVVVLVTGIHGLLSWAGGSGARSLAVGTEGLGDLLGTLENIDALRTKNQDLKKQLGNEEIICIDNGKVSELLRSIETSGRQSGLRINIFDPTERPKSRPMPSLEVKVTFDCRFNQLVQFLAQLERPEIAVFVRDMRAGRKDAGQSNLSVTMTLVTYLVK